MATVTIKKRSLDIPGSGKKKKSAVKTFVLNPYTIIFFLVLFIAMTSFLYLSEFNAIATQGVVINDLERDRSTLIIENEVWNMRIAKLKSMDVIDKQAVVKRMPSIDPSEIEFVDLDRMEETSGNP